MRGADGDLWLLLGQKGQNSVELWRSTLSHPSLLAISWGMTCPGCPKGTALPLPGEAARKHLELLVGSMREIHERGSLRKVWGLLFPETN